MATGCLCVLVPFSPLSSRRCEVDKYYLKKEYSFFPSALCGYLPIITKHPTKPFSQREFSFLEVIQIILQVVQNRTVEQVVVPVGDSTCASRAHPRTNFGAGCRYPFRGRLHSPDSGGNFRVCVIRHTFHLAQILRAHDTRSQVSSSFSLLSWGRAVRRTLKPVTPLEPLMESSRSAVLLTSIPRPMHRISSETGLRRKRMVVSSAVMGARCASATIVASSPATGKSRATRWQPS